MGRRRRRPRRGRLRRIGHAQVAVYRPINGTWYIRSSGAGGGSGTAAGGIEPVVTVTAPWRATSPSRPTTTASAGSRRRSSGRPPRRSTSTTRSPRRPAPWRCPSCRAGGDDVIIPAPADYTGDGKADAAIFDQTLGTYEYLNSATGAVRTQVFFATSQDIPPGSPYQYRAAANTAAPGFTTAGAILGGSGAGGAATPALAGGGSSGGSSAGVASASASAALVIGAPVPAGSTSTGKASTLPTGTVLKAPPIVFTTSAGSARPAQGDATDSAIASLGKSYNGLFF